MRAREEMKNYGMTTRILLSLQKKGIHVLSRKLIATLSGTVLASVFFLLSSPWISKAQVPDAHKICISCHIEEGSGTLREGIDAICIGCHPNSPGNDHPIGLAVADIPKKLPLDEEGKITCITCHEPHGKGTEERLLRIRFNDLCIECHKI